MHKVGLEPLLDLLKGLVFVGVDRVVGRGAVLVRVVLVEFGNVVARPGEGKCLPVLGGGAACAGTAAVRQAGDRAALTTIWLAAAGLAVGSVFLDVTGMIERINGRLAGPTLDANVLAHICGLGVVALGLTIRRSTFYRLVCALPLLYVVYESETRTILVALAVAAGTALLGRAPRTLLIGALVIAPLVIAFDFASSLETAVQRSSDEDLSNLSGRIGVW